MVTAISADFHGFTIGAAGTSACVACVESCMVGLGASTCYELMPNDKTPTSP